MNLLGALLAIAGASLWWLGRPFTAPAFGGAAPIAASVYDDRGGNAPLLSPYTLAIDPMDGLVLLGIEKDPDSIYVGFEPQRFRDTVHGDGLLVLGWRVDRRVDVFHSPGLRLDTATFGIAGAGLHAMVERRFDRARFAFTGAGPELDVAFDDLAGRRIALRVVERNARERRPFGLLAPMGSAATRPPALPLVYLHDFDFVRVADTDVAIRVDGRTHRPERLPLPLGGQRRWFLRWSPDPFIVTWNRAHDGALPPLQRTDDPQRASGAGGRVTYDLVAHHGRTAIARMSATDAHHAVQVEFDPALPQLAALANGARAEGRFRIRAHPTVGVVTGRWRVARTADTITVTSQPVGGWTPREEQFLVRLIYRLGGVFMSWPTTYRHEAVLTPDGAGGYHLRSGWTRLGAP